MQAHGGRESGYDAAPRSSLVNEGAAWAAWLRQLARAGLPVREGQTGESVLRVDSVEPTTGDPQLLAVRALDEPGAWWVDRRTMRINRVPEGSRLGLSTVVAAADLADRAQLVLGRPLTLSWGLDEGEVFLDAVEPLSPCVQFTNASYRRIAPMMASPGTLCPLSVDILNQALRRDHDEDGEKRVRRMYAQAYRRLEVPARVAGGPHHSRRERLGRALRRAGEVLTDLTLPAAELSRFTRDFTLRLSAFDSERLNALDTQDLHDSINARVSVVVEVLGLLERSRLATLSLLPALQAAAGPISREQLAVLAEPSSTLSRRTANDRLIALGHALARERGETSPPEAADSGSLRRAWARARETLGELRVTGMDVRPGPAGESDAELLRAVCEARSLLDVAPEQRRRDAEREVIEAAGTRRGGGAIAWLSLLPLKRLARAKGDINDLLSLSLLRVRSAVLEAGDRLSREGILDATQDVFYLELDELFEALQGELGAYAARSRFRLEDDQRWRNFNPPRRIGGRRM